MTNQSDPLDEYRFRDSENTDSLEEKSKVEILPSYVPSDYFGDEEDFTGYSDSVDIGPYASGLTPPWEQTYTANKKTTKPKTPTPRKPVPSIKPPPKFPTRAPIHKPRVPMTEADRLMLTELAEAYKLLLTDLVSQDKLPPAIIDRIEEINRIIANIVPRNIIT